MFERTHPTYHGDKMNIETRQDFRDLSDRLLKSDQNDDRFALWADREEDGVSELEVECRWSGRKALVQFEVLGGRGYTHIIPLGNTLSIREQKAWWAAQLHDTML